MYRPTWRMDDVFKNYVEGIAEVTTLSAVQVARLAIFSAPFSATFLSIAADKRQRILGDVSLSLPVWGRNDSGLWLSEEWDRGERGGRQDEGSATIGSVTVAI